MKYIMIFISFLIANAILTVINFYQAKYITPTVWNLLKYNFYLLPAFFVTNFLYTYTMNRAYAVVGKMTPVVAILWGTIVFAAVILNYVFFKEIPKNNVLIGLCITVVGIIIVNYK